MTEARTGPPPEKEKATRLGTTVAHLEDNLHAGTGRLPDAPTRRRMAEYLDRL